MSYEVKKWRNENFVLVKRCSFFQLGRGFRGFNVPSIGLTGNPVYLACIEDI